jgi:cell division protein ZapE
VDDVGDAMLLAGLLHAWLELGVTLLFTSNISPDALYLNGLQRERFLPAIQLIQTHTTVMCLGGKRDFRFSQDRGLPYFSWGVGPQCDQWLSTNFQRLTGDVARYDVQLDVNDRSIRARGCAPGVVWFDFHELCATARSALDYLKLCDQFQEIFIGNIVPTNDETADTAARFIQLIDAIYDHGIRLWASSSTTIETLYSGRTLAFDFQRTHSRFQKLLGPR